jgi:hypothetical protein
MCPNANGQAQGFAADARITGPERTFLDRLQINSTTPASPEAAQACEGVIAQRAASSNRRRTTLFDQACRDVGFPTPTQQQPTIPRDVIEAIPEILNRDDDDRPSTSSTSNQSPAPRTGRFTLRLGQWANFGSGQTSASGGDIGLAQGRSGAYLTGGQTGEIALAPGGQASQQSCRQASYGASVMLERLRAGAGFCVRLSNGAVVAAQVGDASAETISFSYSAWPAQ